MDNFVIFVVTMGCFLLYFQDSINNVDMIYVLAVVLGCRRLSSVSGWTSTVSSRFSSVGSVGSAVRSVPGSTAAS